MDEEGEEEDVGNRQEESPNLRGQVQQVGGGVDQQNQIEDEEDHC